VADSAYEKRRKQKIKEYGSVRSVRAPSYEGFSPYTDESGPEAFILALRAASKAAVRRARTDGVELPGWYEITRVRILVGNPNVKVLGTTITKSSAPDE
jgi:hypothetical protein